MEGATKQAKFFIPLHQTKLSGQVSGPIARFTIILTFRYTKEDCPETVDAVNRFLSGGTPPSKRSERSSAGMRSRAN